MTILNNKKPVREIVKNEEWQNVRKKLLGKWNINPDYCVEQLENFLGDVEKASDEKIIIIHNYLTGTGFRIGAIKETKKIRELKDKIRNEIKRRKNNVK